MFKKWMAAILAAAMVLCFTACDGNGDTENTTTTTTTTTTTATTTQAKPTLSDDEMREAFMDIASKVIHFGSFADVYSLSERIVFPVMNLVLEGEKTEYAKAKNGTPLYKEVLTSETINETLMVLIGRSLDPTSVPKEGVGDPAIYEYKHPSATVFEYYDLDHNLKLEEQTFVCDEYTEGAYGTYTVKYHIDYSGSTPDKNFVLQAQYLGNNAFMAMSNQEQ